MRNKYILHYKKVNLIWIIDLNLQAKILNILEKNEKNLCEFGLGEDFIDSLQKI